MNFVEFLEAFARIAEVSNTEIPDKAFILEFTEDDKPLCDKIEISFITIKPYMAYRRRR